MHVDYVGPSTIIVKWEKIDIKHWNGRLRGYNVKYGPMDQYGSYSEVKNKKVNSHWQTNATLSDLERNTEYRIEVAGVNGMGEGVYSKPVKAQTCKFKSNKFIKVCFIYTSLTCEKHKYAYFADDPCDSGPCHNGGTCTIYNPDDRRSSKSNLFHCVCAVNFTGVFCTSFISGK